MWGKKIFKNMPKINPFPWLSSLWFKKSWTVFQTQTVLTVDKYLPWTLFLFFSRFLQEYDKEVKGFVYCLEGSSQTVKIQTPDSSKVSRKLASILAPICKLFQIFVDTQLPLFVVRTRRLLQLGSSTDLWSFNLTFLRAKISPLRLCKYNMYFFSNNSFLPIVTPKANFKSICERCCSFAEKLRTDCTLCCFQKLFDVTMFNINV